MRDPRPTGVTSGMREAPHEPILAADDIQGNIIPGFLKPHQRLIGLVIDEPGRTKAWLRALAPSLTSLAQAMGTRVRVRAHRGLRRAVVNEFNPVPQGLDDLWVNVAFSYAGLTKLAQGSGKLADDLGQFTDEAFVAGLASRSAALGDPTDPAAPGNPRNWKVGGDSGEPDILLILAVDAADRLDELTAQVVGDTAAHGLSRVYDEVAGKLDPQGREHFGFKDGVSQPGVRGLYSERADAYITPRTVAARSGPKSLLYGLPGQYLVWPGEFVFGYAGQGGDPLIPGPERMDGPPWARNGSYLVFRRLSQDVPGFMAFLAAQAAKLAATPAFSDIDAERLGAYLIGRWPSGAPVSRAPEADNPELGADRLENNYMEFGASVRSLELVNGEYTDHFPSASADPIGLVCPMAAHIRKVNSRSAANDQGGIRASYNRRILRRGLPYGKLYSEAEPTGEERGLLFVSYQTSIVDQFEFLVSSWMGSPTNPRSPSGYDLVVGQNGQPGEGRIRTAIIIEHGGQLATVAADRDVVTPTGGGYFFSPSISAVRDVIGGTAAG